MFNADELLNYLRYIPTGDNAQQFSFEACANSITVLHSEETARHSFNQSNVASFLSLGMIVHVINVYCEKNKLVCHFTYPSNFGNSTHWLECNFSPDLSENHSQQNQKYSYDLDVIFNRYTDRGPYKRSPLNFDHLQEKYKNFIAFKTHLSKSAYKSIVRCESMIFDDLKAFKDIENWARYSKAEVEKTKTGMSIKNLGLDIFHGQLFKYFKKESIINILLAPYFKLLTWIKVVFLYPRSTGFGLCYLKSNKDEDIILMGEKIMGVWLDITAIGGTLQPISSPTLLPFIYRNRKGIFHKDYANDLNSCNEKFNKEFNIQGEVIWSFRFGPATNAKKNNRTLRLSLNQNKALNFTPIQKQALQRENAQKRG